VQTLAESLDFTAAEAALVAKLITDIGIFTSDNLKAHDFDAVYIYALQNDVRYFAWTDYAGGQGQGRGIWAHLCALRVGIFFTNGAAELDDNIRSVVNSLITTLLPDTRLSGQVQSARIETIDAPVPWDNQENNIPHVEITFHIVLEEAMPTGSRR